jgi:predicted Fe-Mo cluster-binding NifX family protein
MVRIAVPVEGENLRIVTRTGRAPYFAIFQFDGERFQLEKLTENTHAKEHREGEGHQEAHTEEEIAHHHHHVKASQLGECQFIVVRAVGPNMREALKREGIKIVKVSQKDGEYAPEVLEKVKGEFK